MQRAVAASAPSSTRSTPTNRPTRIACPPRAACLLGPVPAVLADAPAEAAATQAGTGAAPSSPSRWPAIAATVATSSITGRLTRVLVGEEAAQQQRQLAGSTSPTSTASAVASSPTTI